MQASWRVLIHRDRLEQPWGRSCSLQGCQLGHCSTCMLQSSFPAQSRCASTASCMPHVQALLLRDTLQEVVVVFHSPEGNPVSKCSFIVQVRLKAANTSTDEQSWLPYTTNGCIISTKAAVASRLSISAAVASTDFSCRCAACCMHSH